MSERQIALAKVGMRALIDEATGYQEARTSDDLRRYAQGLGIERFVEIVAERIALAQVSADEDDDLTVLGFCPHGVDLDREFCPKGCRV